MELLCLGARNFESISHHTVYGQNLVDRLERWKQVKNNCWMNESHVYPTDTRLFPVIYLPSSQWMEVPGQSLRRKSDQKILWIFQVFTGSSASFESLTSIALSFWTDFFEVDSNLTSKNSRNTTPQGTTCCTNLPKKKIWLTKKHGETPQAHPSSFISLFPAFDICAARTWHRNLLADLKNLVPPCFFRGFSLAPFPVGFRLK